MPAGRLLIRGSPDRPWCVRALAIVVAIVLSPLAAGAGEIFGFGTYTTPSSSNEPTLLRGDHFVTLPRAKPARGDVVVYRLPSDDQVVYVKRIVGLPGDRVQMKSGVLHINDQAVPRERIEDFMLANDSGAAAPVTQWRETLPGGLSHRTLDINANSFYDTTPLVTVPEGHYFMMGDNRDNSVDSRARNHSTIPAANIVGRAEFIFFSVAETSGLWRFWRWPWTIRWRRIPSRVR